MLVSRLTYAVVKVPLVFSAPWFITSGAVNPAFNISGPAALILKAGIVPVPSSPSVSPHCPGPSPRSSPADLPTAALVQHCCCSTALAPHWRFRGCGSAVAVPRLRLAVSSSDRGRLVALSSPSSDDQSWASNPANPLWPTISG